MRDVNVLITVNFSDDLMEMLQAVSPRLNLIRHPTPRADDIPVETWETVNVLYTLSALPAPELVPNLHWVQLHTAGAETALAHPLMAARRILLTTTSGIHAVPMAEYTFALMLAFARKVPEMVMWKTEGIWPEKRRRFAPVELRGATLGIIGYGSIGREIARLAKAFGMKVLAIKRDVRHIEDREYTEPGIGDPDGELPDRLYPPEAMHSMLGECDYVVLTVPLTPQTERMFDSQAFQAMKPTAILINIARGGVVDEDALVEALREGRIAGAGLDVFSQEPLPPDSPIWKLPNLIMSPHIAGASPRYNERAARLFAENLGRYLEGETLLNLVRQDRGY